MKWQLTKINQGYQMTRVNGQEIECRNLYWWEKVLKLLTITKPLPAIRVFYENLQNNRSK